MAVFGPSLLPSNGPRAPFLSLRLAFPFLSRPSSPRLPYHPKSSFPPPTGLLYPSFADRWTRRPHLSAPSPTSGRHLPPTSPLNPPPPVSCAHARPRGSGCHPLHYFPYFSPNFGAQSSHDPPPCRHLHPPAILASPSLNLAPSPIKSIPRTPSPIFPLSPKLATPPYRARIAEPVHRHSPPCSSRASSLLPLLPSHATASTGSSCHATSRPSLHSLKPPPKPPPHHTTRASSSPSNSGGRTSPFQAALGLGPLFLSSATPRGSPASPHPSSLLPESIPRCDR